ncbi:MAG: hypothetical protein NVS2B16_01950 [Chloroflexota bacterium]
MTLLIACALGIAAGIGIHSRTRAFAACTGVWCALVALSVATRHQVQAARLGNPDRWIFPILILYLTCIGIWIGTCCRRRDAATA